MFIYPVYHILCVYVDPVLSNTNLKLFTRRFVGASRHRVQDYITFYIFDHLVTS